MEPVVVAVLIGIAVYFVVVAIIPPHILVESTSYTRSMLQQLEEDTLKTESEDTVSVLRKQMANSNLITRVFFTLPGAKRMYPRLLKAGLGQSIEAFFISFLVLFLFLVHLMKGMGLIGLGLAAGLTYLAARGYIKRRIRK